jgi:hypothetical protein
MLILFVLGVSVLVIALTVGIDVSEQIWAEKHAERTAFKKKQLEAFVTLRDALLERVQRTVDVDVVVELPKKSAGAKHRLVA